MEISEPFGVKDHGVVVTGGASGLGLAFADALAENGAHVTLIDANAQRIADKTKRLKALGYAGARNRRAPASRCSRSTTGCDRQTRITTLPKCAPAIMCA